MIDPKFIETIREKAADSIVDIIDSRVKLKKSGKSFTACCPFHDENTPSFHVDEVKGKYTCYGSCRGGSVGHGDAIAFIMNYERVQFDEAIHILARDLGLNVEYIKDKPADKEVATESAAIKSACAAAADSFIKTLPLNKHIVDYLKARGIVSSDVQNFIIGYAPKDWTYLRDSLSTRFSADILHKASLVEIPDDKAKSRHDYFNDRVMFPIRNEKGEFIAFGGRVIDDRKPKYKNSRTSSVFDKSNTLYGLYEASKNLHPINARNWFVVEGYFDVISCHRHSYTNTCAAMGTAFSEGQGKKLFIRGDNICFMQDGDSAGIKAIFNGMKAIAPLLTPDKTCTAVLFPDGEDPDSLLKTPEGKKTFEALVSKPISMVEFLVNHVSKMHEPTPEGKAAAIESIGSIIETIKVPALQLTLRQAILDMSGITIADANQLQNRKPTLAERRKSTYSKVPEEFAARIKSLSLNDLAFAGLLIQSKSWLNILDIPDHVENTNISFELRGLLKVALKRETHPNILPELCDYLVACIPDEHEQQLEIVSKFKNRLRFDLSRDAEHSVYHGAIRGSSMTQS